MNTAEIDISLNEIRQYLGSDVENVFFVKDTLILQLQHPQAGKPVYLMMSAKTSLSLLVLLDDLPFKIKSEVKPIYLFTKKHLSHATLIDVERDESLGRVVKFDLLSAEDRSEISIEQFLIPTHWNIKVTTKDKSIYLNAPKELPPFQSAPIFDKAENEDEVLQKYKKKALDFFQQKTPTKNKKTPLIASEIIKKEKLLKKIGEDLTDKGEQDYKIFAELLGVNPEKAEKDFPAYFDRKKDIYELQKEFFEKHKKNKNKIDRIHERQKELLEEINKLKNLSPEEWEKQNQAEVTLSPSKAKNKVQTRKLEVAKDCIAYMGKSAKDNVLLLRQAKAWHHWLHVKDEPSAYVIVQGPKNKKLAFAEVQTIAKWFVAASNKLSKNFVSGDKLTLLVTQCRYVRPIKGDKLGRVSYTHEQVYTVSL